MVDVTGVDRKELLKGLWINSSPAAFFMGLGGPQFEYPQANDREIQRGGYVDYYRGRMIKSAVFSEKNIIDPYLYDRDIGQGSFQRIVNQLK